MRKYLLPENGMFYKANLHSHCEVSDGSFTAKQLKDMYKANGYSILAFTDHEVLVEHSELDDDEFITLTGMEYAFLEKEDYFTSRTIELNMYAKDQHNIKQVCWNPEYAISTWEEFINKVEYVGDIFKREYTVECIQKVIDEANANGFLVSLNHPGYSMETPEFFGKLNGLFAMEIYNHNSFCGGVYDYNPAMYDDMLRRGKNLYCIAADDAHGGAPDGAPKCDRYGGFVMIKAPELEYSKIIKALSDGDFYASQGPLINELYIDGDEVHIKCSPAKYIAMNTSHRPFGGIQIAADGELITDTTFKLPIGQKYMRFDVMDEKGRHANTRAYFVE